MERLMAKWYKHIDPNYHLIIKVIKKEEIAEKEVYLENQEMQAISYYKILKRTRNTSKKFTIINKTVRTEFVDYLEKVESKVHTIKDSVWENIYFLLLGKQEDL